MPTPEQTAALDAMADNARELGLTYDDAPLPEPFDYCYEWDGPYGNRKFSVAAHNGRPCDRSVAIFNAAQLRDYGQQCAKAALEAAAQWYLRGYGGPPGSVAQIVAEHLADEIRALAAAGVV